MTVNIPLSLLDTLHAIAIDAGKAILEVYNSNFQVDAKADRSPVTEADRRAEDLITRRIKADIGEAFPIIGEEAFSEGRAPVIGDTPFWLVDPLDGTKEFVSRNGEFTVNIALIEFGRPVLGVVHAPAINQIFMGSRHGASASIGGARPQPIRCRTAPTNGLTALVSRSHSSPETDEFLKDFTIKEEISSGSSLKFCMVARGLADIYPRLGRTMEWDTAAGHAVLKAAGGSVKTLEDRELSYGKPGFENPHFVAWGLQDK
ncbi:MAG: 3'(2'),5'-bisphosphate nucleotidase CysQ [Rhodospirillales bacterium]|nr:3'(2'),5'-bisphosphate nucleotidase CysQ [Rhodospirillales bacterium]